MFEAVWGYTNKCSGFKLASIECCLGLGEDLKHDWVVKGQGNFGIWRFVERGFQFGDVLGCFSLPKYLSWWSIVFLKHEASSS